MKYICTYILLFLSIYHNAQNLVPNPSFEAHTTCTNNPAQISNAAPWQASISTPDYFNSCSTNTNSSVPINLSNCNFQYPFSGNAYAGIQTLVLMWPNTRENLSVPLISTLINNNYYLVKFYTNKINCIQYAHNNIALNFSSVLTTTVSAGNTVNLPMHIYKFGNPIISDTLNWTEIMGIYKANGTEQYITIGNFKDDANTKVLLANSTNSSTASYYLIDDVSVEPICTPFWSYRDTAVAIGDSVLIGPAITGLNINWYDASGTFITNAPGIYVKPNSPTFYTATEDFCGSIVTHTIHVGASPLSVKAITSNQRDFTIAPNPTDGVLRISTSLDVTQTLNDKNVTIQLLNSLGQILLSETMNDTTHQLNLQNFAEGIYFVKVSYVNGQSVIKKVVKQ
jgi:hypothetical protein